MITTGLELTSPTLIGAGWAVGAAEGSVAAADDPMTLQSLFKLVKIVRPHEVERSKRLVDADLVDVV